MLLLLNSDYGAVKKTLKLNRFLAQCCQIGFFDAKFDKFGFL